MCWSELLTEGVADTDLNAHVFRSSFVVDDSTNIESGAVFVSNGPLDGDIGAAYNVMSIKHGFLALGSTSARLALLLPTALGRDNWSNL